MGNVLMQRGVGDTYAQDPGIEPFAAEPNAGRHHPYERSHPAPAMYEPPLRLSAVGALPQPWATSMLEPPFNEPVMTPPVTLPVTQTFDPPFIPLRAECS